jgi:hypothetical protein
MAGLLELSPEAIGLLTAGAGMLQASRPSTTPGGGLAAIGAGIPAGLQAYQQAQQAALQKKAQERSGELQSEQLKHLRMQMEQEALLNPLRIKELERKIKQQELQAQIPAIIMQEIGRLGGSSQGPSLYQDQIKPEQVGSSSLPTVSLDQQKADKGGFQVKTPEDFFNYAMKVKDPVEKQAMIEAGFRQWPQYRPQVNQEQSAFGNDSARTVATLGAMLSANDLKGGESLLKLAEFFKPQERKEGVTYVDSKGRAQYMPKLEVGMVPDASGGVKMIPGMEEYLRKKSIATVDPLQAAKFGYETGQTVPGFSTQSGISQVGLSPKDRAEVGTKSLLSTNEDWVKNSYRPTLEKATLSDSMISNIQALRNIDINTGWGTEAMAGAANVLSTLGVAPKNAELFAANAQKFQSVAMDRLWEVLNAAKGPQTEKDADRAKATFAQLQNRPEANQFILDMAEANSRRDKLKAAFYAEAMPVARADGDLSAVDRKWSQIQKSIWDDPIMAKWKKQ